MGRRQKPFKYLERAQNYYGGEPFFLELTGYTLNLLMKSARLSLEELAILLHRSETQTASLLAGDVSFAPSVALDVERAFCVRVLTPPKIYDQPPLVQLTKRSLRLFRHDALRLTRQEFAVRARVSSRYIGKIETGELIDPSQIMRQSLGRALKVRFFLL